jgi:Ti-type conjugative transfer relaxase TraA
MHFFKVQQLEALSTMALAHFSAKFIQASRSPVAAAAYRHRTTMRDDSTGETYSYTRADDLAHSELSIPDNSPDWLRNLLSKSTASDNSQVLWNTIQEQENQLHGQYAREIVIALPIELSVAQNIDLMRDFIAREFTAKGLIADWVYHDKPGNPHVHLMHTLRSIEPTGFGRKRIPLCDIAGAFLMHNGKRVYRPVIGTRADFFETRTEWGATATRHLRAAGFDLTIDMSSYASRGIGITPTTHRGPAVNALVIKAKKSTIADLQKLDIAAAAQQILARPELVLSIVTSQQSTFGERDIAKIAHRFSPDTGAYNAIVAAVMASSELTQRRPDILDPHTGKIVAPAVYSTLTLVKIERQMADNTELLITKASPAVPQVLVARAVADMEASVGFKLLTEQVEAVQLITAAGDIASAIGVAGTGKSTMLAAANAAWTADGRRVIGGTLGGKAAEALLGSSGIPSQTLARWQLAWEQGRDKLRPGDVFVLDEAGMVGSPQLAAFLAAAKSAGAKIVLVGDPEQLQPIEAGAAFRAITERTGCALLTDVIRQTQPWQRLATKDLASGQTRAALARYRAAGNIVTPATRDDAISDIVAAYTARHAAEPKASLMVLAHSNAAVYQLNQSIRAALAASLGAATTFTTDTGSRTFATGDRLIFLENKTFRFDGARELGNQTVKNGSLGLVLDTANGILRVKLDTGQTVVFDQATYGYLDHGYAATVHKNQGATVDHAFVLAGPTMERHLAYVALSRHRTSVQLYAPLDDFKKQSLDDCLSRSAGKTTTLDYDSEDDFIARRGFHPLSSIIATTRAVLADQRARLSALGDRLRAILPTKSAIAFQGLPARRWNTISINEAVNSAITTNPIWQQRDTRFMAVLATVYADPKQALGTMTAALLTAGDPAALRQTPLGAYGAIKQTALTETALAIAAYHRASIRDVIAQRPALIAAETARRTSRLIDIPAPSVALATLIDTMRRTGRSPAVAAELLGKTIEPAVAAEIATINVALDARFGAKLLWSQPNEAVTIRILDGALPADRAALRAAIPTLLAIRQLNRFVPRIIAATTPDDPVAAKTFQEEAPGKLIYDHVNGTVSYPQNPEANKAIGEIATWNNESNVYVIKDGTSQRDIDSAIRDTERAIEKAAALQQRGEQLVAQLKAGPLADLRPELIDNRLCISIPQRMEAAKIAAKRMGVVYCKTKTDPSRWSVHLGSVSDDRIHRSLSNIANEIRQAELTNTIAGTMANAGHPDDRIKLSNAAETLYVRSPFLPSADNHLKDAGFKWDDDAGAYALKIDATVDSSKVTTWLSAASAAYDNALMPPTADRDGVDHPPWRVADVLKLDADGMRAALAADTKLTQLARIYANQVERGAPGVKDELNSVEFESLAAKLGIPTELAANLITIHKSLDAALKPVEPAQTLSRVEALVVSM